MAELPDFPTDPVLARKLQRVGSPAGVAIALGDPAGCIEWVNAAFQQLTGYAAAEMTGKRLDLLRGLDIGASALDYVMSRFRRGEPSHLEIRTRATGSRDARRLAIEIRPLGPDQGFVALVREVSGPRRDRDGDRRRHPAARGRLRDAERSAPPLPRPRLARQPLELSHLVMQSCEFLEAAVSGRTLLDLDLAGNLPTIRADVGRLRAVLVSLVRHAAENLEGAQGSVCVRTSLIPSEEEGGGRQVGLEVRHTAWGTVTPSPHDDFAWAGRPARSLGLEDARAVVESHGGSLSIASGPGAARKVLVLLPCDPETERG